MRLIKHSLAAAALAVASTGAFAGIPVIDGTNLAQQIQQVISWGKQYTGMVQQVQNQVQQIQKAQATLQAIQGARNLGDVLNVVSMTGMVPQNVQQQLQAVQNINNLATSLRNISGNSLAASQQRGQQIVALMQAVNSTIDPKGAAEIQARIGAEQAQVTNDTNRLQILGMQAAAEKERIEQAIKKRFDDQVTATGRTAAPVMSFSM
jgi:type IV secretion system protein VirB5